ncbi:hypothetical protein SAMN05660461_6419 [Chitinophaga ginsengisegetis]|uniref:Uncharacterized protein n=1 Tax=Chitinophaga ginsengisegetis TaxID=393003 RepID=A0A1T5PCP6_9BACT|nr:hypothetical protein [Chitinophaga ginsengisegetis]MDR6655226.1 hypothetical protein [Chitinophaga ginsengisegetis]SKD10501.1 hypothetical protein SAMN05660461_6419 [Chitinophaga ginsengisegetis]
MGEGQKKIRSATAEMKNGCKSPDLQPFQNIKVFTVNLTQ